MKFAVTAVLIIASLASSVYSRDRSDSYPHKVVCYYQSWTEYHKGEEHFVAEDINYNVCTHLNYAFAQLQNNSIAFFDKVVDVDHHMIERMAALRKHNPKLKTMISLGGWSEGSTKYSEMVRSEAHRKQLVNSIVKFLQKYDLDGVDLDWEYPGFVGVGDGDRKPGRAEDKHDFVTLLKELKEAFKPQGYLLSAAVGAGKYQMDIAYDVPGLNKYLDFINLMTYDYHGTWEHQTGHNAPLYGSSESDIENIHSTVDYWLKHGADSKKLILGIPLYGMGFKLASTDDTKVGAKSTGGVDGGSYGKFCQAVKHSGWVEHWDEKAQVPYAVNAKKHEWVSYENLKSLKIKLDYVLQKKLGGSMVWAVDGDDVHNHCGSGKYAMMKLQMKVLNKVDAADVNTPHHN